MWSQRDGIHYVPLTKPSISHSLSNIYQLRRGRSNIYCTFLLSWIQTGEPEQTSSETGSQRWFTCKKPLVLHDCLRLIIDPSIDSSPNLIPVTPVSTWLLFGKNAFPSKGPTPRFLHVSGSPAYDHLFHKRLGHNCAIVSASNGLPWQWSWKVSQSQSWTWNLKIYGLSHVRDPLFQCAILRFWSFNTVLPFAVCTCGENN